MRAVVSFVKRRAGKTGGAGSVIETRHNVPDIKSWLQNAKSTNTENTERDREHGECEQDEPCLPFVSVTSVVVI